MTTTTPPDAPAPEATVPRRATMQVRKRNGDREDVDVMKIVRAVARWCDDLDEVDPMTIATRTISGLYDGATTAELDRLSIQTAAQMTAAEPQYSRLAARLLANYVDKEVSGHQIQWSDPFRGTTCRVACRAACRPPRVARGAGRPTLAAP